MTRNKNILGVITTSLIGLSLAGSSPVTPEGAANYELTPYNFVFFGDKKQDEPCQGGYLIEVEGNNTRISMRNNYFWTKSPNVYIGYYDSKHAAEDIREFPRPSIRTTGEIHPPFYYLDDVSNMPDDVWVKAHIREPGISWWETKYYFNLFGNQEITLSSGKRSVTGQDIELCKDTDMNIRSKAFETNDADLLNESVQIYGRPAERK